MNKDQVVSEILVKINEVEKDFPKYYESLKKELSEFNFSNDSNTMDEYLKEYLYRDSRNYFTIMSKDSFSGFENCSDDHFFIFSPLKDHSRKLMHRGDIVYCYRSGQFDDLDEALCTRGIYGVGFVMSEPKEIYLDKENYERFGVLIYIPYMLKCHLDVKNIQLHPNTINLTPYNGNRNDALQYISDKHHHETLLKMVCKINPELRAKLEKFIGILINDCKMPDEVWNRYDFIEPTEDRKTLFEHFLCTVAKQDDGSHLKEKTVYNYMLYICKEDLNIFIHKNCGFRNIFEISNCSIVEKIYQDLLKDQIDKDSHNTYSSAVLRYKEFLEYRAILSIEEYPLILYGPPGTGKTFMMQQKYSALFSKQNIFLTTFHQSFSYEDFVEGLKPYIIEGTSNVNYRVESGIFYQACEKAAELAGYSKDEDKNLSALDIALEDSCLSREKKFNEAVYNNKLVLFCIDEINRANVSAVFGDLISLIENSKRLGSKNEMILKLPYSKKDFGVPSNLCILGSMNTADRSIQLLDSALRRRFKFLECSPDYNVLMKQDKNNNYVDTDGSMILKSINNRIRALLDKDHQIGQSYLLNLETKLEIFKAFVNSIIPLLEEYFYNDNLKIRKVLNEYNNELKEGEHKFYVQDNKAIEYFKNDVDVDDEIYCLNPEINNVNTEYEAATFLGHLINYE